MQTSTNVPAIMDVSTTATTQLGPITALAIVDGNCHGMGNPAQVWIGQRLPMRYYYIYYYYYVDINECSTNKGGCQHNCHNTAGSYYCTCYSGWELSSDGKTCTGRDNKIIINRITHIPVDINECSGSHGCEHNCHNTAGSYYCTCNSGWVLASNGRNCQGMDNIKFSFHDILYFDLQ